MKFKLFGKPTVEEGVKVQVSLDPIETEVRLSKVEDALRDIKYEHDRKMLGERIIRAISKRYLKFGSKQFIKFFEENLQESLDTVIGYLNLTCVAELDNEGIVTVTIQNEETSRKSYIKYSYEVNEQDIYRVFQIIDKITRRYKDEIERYKF